MTEPIWLTMARDLLGLGEIVGSKHEQKVVGFFADAGVPEIADDETAWCGAFLAAMFVKAQRRDVRPPGDRYNALRAREWLKVGTAVTGSPRPGDIVIFSRGTGTQGHVAFYVEDAGDKIKVLGGNQSNRVSIASYAKSRLLGIRRVQESATAAPAVVQPPKPKPPVAPPQAIPEPDPVEATRGDDKPMSGLEAWARRWFPFLFKGPGR